MAIYHLTAKTVSRGSGTTAKARHEYIEREGRYKADSAEVLHMESGNMPEWAKECPGSYWQAADLYERANGRLFKQLEFALPRELTAEQQKDLATSFVRGLARTNDGPLPYSFAIHQGHDRDNPHCHMMISERVNDGFPRAADSWFRRAGSQPSTGGAKKSIALSPRSWLVDVRQEWEKSANRALERAGHGSRIDCRTLKAQGIDREPTTHLGPAAAAMERKCGVTDRGQEHRASVEQGRQEQLEAAQAEAKYINSGMENARARLEAWQAEQAEKKRQAELEQSRRQEHSKAQIAHKTRDRGGMSR